MNREIEAEIAELKRLVNDMWSVHKIDTYSVPQAAKELGFVGRSKTEKKLFGQKKTVKQWGIIEKEKDRSIALQVYSLLKANPDIEWSKPTPKMIRINRVSLHKFLNKNIQYRKAA